MCPAAGLFVEHGVGLREKFGLVLQLDKRADRVLQNGWCMRLAPGPARTLRRVDGRVTIAPVETPYTPLTPSQ